DVDQNAARLRGRLRDGNRFADMIGSLRSRIDEPGHAVCEAECWSVLDTSGVSMDIDQTRHDELAAGIDYFRGIACDIGLDRGDSAAGDRHVADRIDPE